MPTQKINSPEQVNEVSPSAASNTNDIYRCDSCGASGWTGTINSIGGAVINYIHTSGNQNTLIPASSSQLGKQRLYNTTRSNYALISTSNGTSTITLTANPPANWANTDVITTISPTVIPGGGVNAVDIEIISGDFTGRTLVGIYGFVYDSGAAGTRLAIMPFETYAASKEQDFDTQKAAGVIGFFTLIKLTSNVFSLWWTASGAATDIIGIREAAYII